VKVNLGRALREGGHYREAAELFGEALKQLDANNPDTDPFRVNATIGLGRSLVHLGKTEEALGLLQTALEIGTRKFGADNFRIAEAHLGLSECQVAEGRIGDARASIRKARAIIEPQAKTQPILSREVESALRRLR
ncbi:MAG TPA: tetratricopeptide repeat protein, partial [Gemmatimonadales bacterium]|nr:tetratricopeptide repeat protein [Gemmatimonadales bacterium]